MVRNEALFLNGVYDDVLAEILGIQAFLPEQIMYLQPYSGRPIARLAKHPPSVGDPVRLFVSVTDDLATVRYIGEVVGWDDKRKLPAAKLEVLGRVTRSLQPDEGGIYLKTKEDGPECLNLLHVRRLHRLSEPFSVARLTVASTGMPHSTARTTAGGWSYVVNPSDTWIAEYL